MFDTHSHKMDDMPKQIKKCSSPREVAKISDVCITGLPKPGNVMEAAEGSQGILEGLSEGKIWIDHSTTDFEQTLDFSKKAKSRGAHVLEAPITGGLLALQKGQMVVHIGGQKEISDSVRPILEASYKEIFYVGDIGSAMIVKVVSNMLATINAVAAGEVLLLVPLDLNQLTLAISRRAQYKYGDTTGCYSHPKLYEDTTGESLRHPSFRKWSYENDFTDGSIVVRHKNEE
ncbi:2-(hydroxymethyl)glutarate dehydrogenase [Armadillidium nasatum]|uniref:2-(Hydroxymethyl)glutarate dehydrogenase n=1 Tax=Armadillidium nasatum TaxID=96803 RepID=A0A5N5TE40_9CRUS|nr:2-(hydroxymethyl)glutarate dehydrogenase [Armadillidium nasatum]